MNFEVDRQSSAWAHIALCADITWATEPPDEFVVANQRLWAQYCRVSQVLQDSIETQSSNNQCELSDKRPNSSQTQENGSCSGRRSVKAVIPESRLAQFYGNFYYDDAREKCYTSANEKINAHGYNGQGCDNSDLTECWMLPEVDYWFRKLLDEPAERCLLPRRRRQFRMLADDDFERWGPIGASTSVESTEEAALAAKVSSVKGLWTPRPRVPSPPPPTRKMRARRRQPRRLAHIPPLAYCLDAPAPLLCDPTCKFQFDPPRPPQLTECQKAIGRISASVQAVMRATAVRCPPYRGTNVTRYAPTCQRPARCPERRYGVWWPRENLAAKLDTKTRVNIVPQPSEKVESIPKAEEPKNEDVVEDIKEDSPRSDKPADDSTQTEVENVTPEKADTPKVASPKTPPQKDSPQSDNQMPSTSTAEADTGVKKKRLYSTVLSTSPPAPVNLNQVRLAQKLVTPGLLKLNPKIVMPAQRRAANVDNKFEELEKEALEQYKASDESIDTKFRELEKQAVEQYSTSNSNTSCSSGNSAEKKNSSPLQSVQENEQKTKKSPTKFPKDKSVDSVVIYSQNFPEHPVKKNQTTSVTNLKNFHTPPRGEKKEQLHRPCKNMRSVKTDSQGAVSDTDHTGRESSKGNHKGQMRWTLHVLPPKKRHMTSCVSDCSSDEELEDQTGANKDAGPRMKNHGSGKVKMCAHGGGDLQPILRNAT